VSFVPNKPHGENVAESKCYKLRVLADEQLKPLSKIFLSTGQKLIFEAA
jgi:hypothetical protein